MFLKLTEIGGIEITINASNIEYYYTINGITSLRIINGEYSIKETKEELDDVLDAVSVEKLKDIWGDLGYVEDVLPWE